MVHIYYYLAACSDLVSGDMCHLVNIALVVFVLKKFLAKLSL